MSDGTVLLDRKGAVAEIAFNRPESKNSLRPQELALLTEHLDAVEARGNGVFCRLGERRLDLLDLAGGKGGRRLVGAVAEIVPGHLPDGLN